MSSYTVASIITSFWIALLALLGEAARWHRGQGFNSRRAVAWFVLGVGMAFLGGVVGGLIALAL